MIKQSLKKYSFLIYTFFVLLGTMAIYPTGDNTGGPNVVAKREPKRKPKRKPKRVQSNSVAFSK